MAGCDFPRRRPKSQIPTFTIDVTKTPAEGRENAKQKRGRFDTTLEFAQNLVFVCRRRTAIIYVHRKRVATTCCPGPWFV
jgi:hypothetical protein